VVIVSARRPGPLVTQQEPGTDTDVKTKLGAWVWDTTEVQSGITFNPPTLAAAKMAADLPDYP
jgi:hypothetical protein